MIMAVAVAALLMAQGKFHPASQDDLLQYPIVAHRPYPYMWGVPTLGSPTYHLSCASPLVTKARPGQYLSIYCLDNHDHLWWVHIYSSRQWRWKLLRTHVPLSDLQHQ